MLTVKKIVAVVAYVLLYAVLVFVNYGALDEFSKVLEKWFEKDYVD